MQTDEGKKTEHNHDRCKTDDEKGWTVCKMSDKQTRTHTRTRGKRYKIEVPSAEPQNGSARSFETSDAKWNSQQHEFPAAYHRGACSVRGHDTSNDPSLR